jgi:hypothetical protein
VQIVHNQLELSKSGLSMQEVLDCKLNEAKAIVNLLQYAQMEGKKKPEEQKTNKINFYKDEKTIEDEAATDKSPGEILQARVLL